MKANKMSLVFMITIIKNGYFNDIIEYLQDKGVSLSLHTLGNGTISNKVIDLLGIGDTKKDVIFSTYPSYYQYDILTGLKEKFSLDEPNSGIVLTIAIDGVCGSKNYDIMYGNFLEEGEKKHMEHENEFDLIISIVESGFSDDVIKYARLQGAKGGTIIDARGTAGKEAAKFFGITIHPEKELVLILSRKDNRDNIMTEIKKSTKSLVFSLPVSNVMGLNTLADIKEFTD